MVPDSSIVLFLCLFESLERCEALQVKKTAPLKSTAVTLRHTNPDLKRRMHLLQVFVPGDLLGGIDDVSSSTHDLLKPLTSCVAPCAVVDVAFLIK